MEKIYQTDNETNRPIIEAVYHYQEHGCGRESRFAGPD